MILDLNDRKAGDVDYKQLTFLSGENHFQLLDNGILQYTAYEPVEIHLRFHEDRQLITLLMANDALKRHFIQGRFLWLPYFPGSRDDRVANPGEALSVKVYADLINSGDFDRVHVFDPHSDVTSALVDKIIVHNNYRHVSKALNTLGDLSKLVLVSPDAGSNKKIFGLLGHLKQREEFSSLTVVRADKKRDTLTGELSGTVVYGEDLTDCTCIIVDDICSRGGTFKGLATELKKKNAAKVYLIVSHYENSANKAQLKESGIDHVYCTNSMRDIESDDFITQYNVFDVM